MSIDARPAMRAGVALALAFLSSACSKKYVEIEVRDPGRVSVATLTTAGPRMVLPPDGSPRVVPLSPPPGPVAMRRGRDVGIAWEGREPVALVDEHGVLPRTPTSEGVEVHGNALFAQYNVAPNRVWPPSVTREDAIPIAMSTEMSNVVDAREVKEVRHWPGYVFLPTGVAFTVLGTGLLAAHDTSSEVGGTFYLLAGIPLLVVGVVNLLSSNEIKPLDLAPAASP